MYLGELIEFGADRDDLHHARATAHPGLHHRPLRLMNGEQNMARTYPQALRRGAGAAELDHQRDGRPGREPARADAWWRCASAIREVAEQVIVADARVDALDEAVQEQTVKLLALRQPMAVDLRVILSSIKIAAALERIADYAKNIAKRSIVLNSVTAPPSAVAGIDRAGPPGAHGAQGRARRLRRRATSPRRTTSGSATRRSTRSTPACSASC